MVNLHNKRFQIQCLFYHLGFFTIWLQFGNTIHSLQFILNVYCKLQKRLFQAVKWWFGLHYLLDALQSQYEILQLIKQRHNTHLKQHQCLWRNRYKVIKPTCSFYISKCCFKIKRGWYMILQQQGYKFRNRQYKMHRFLPEWHSSL